MEKKSIKIGNAQGFWGDRPTAAAELLRQQPDLDYLTLDYLAEVSLSIMAIQRQIDPQCGYAKDLLETINSLIPLWKEGSTTKFISNGGGLNPLGCALKCRKLLDEAGCQHLKIGILDGDDVLPLIRSNGQTKLFANLDTLEPIEAVENRLITANAYLGAGSIAELIRKGAHIIITGRVADPSLTVAPCLVDLNWKEDEYDKIAQATVAGHLIECGSQVTGGITTDWLQHLSSIENAANLGFPYVEVNADGSFVISKPSESGGRVDEETVKEQLVYEISDPNAYLSPDATVSFLSISIENVGQNRILVKGATGRPPSNTYKVSATYDDGYKAEAMLAIFGPEAVKKAKLCGEIILERVKQQGYALQRTHIECLGAGDVVKGVAFSNKEEPIECVLRIAVADARKEALECFVKEIAPLVTSGPQGTVGYTTGRPHIRQVFGYWPCLIECTRVHPRLQII